MPISPKSDYPIMAKLLNEMFFEMLLLSLDSLTFRPPLPSYTHESNLPITRLKKRMLKEEHRTGHLIPLNPINSPPRTYGGNLCYKIPPLSLSLGRCGQILLCI